MGFREKLEHLLARRGKTKTELARHLGVKQQQVSNWLENDKAPQKHEDLLEMARHLGVTVEYLIDPEQGSDEDLVAATLTPAEATVVGYMRGAGPEQAANLASNLKQIPVVVANHRLLQVQIIERGEPRGPAPDVLPVGRREGHGGDGGVGRVAADRLPPRRRSG